MDDGAIPFLKPFLLARSENHPSTEAKRQNNTSLIDPGKLGWILKKILVPRRDETGLFCSSTFLKDKQVKFKLHCGRPKLSKRQHRRLEVLWRVVLEWQQGGRCEENTFWVRIDFLIQLYSRFKSLSPPKVPGWTFTFFVPSPFIVKEWLFAFSPKSGTFPSCERWRKYSCFSDRN